MSSLQLGNSSSFRTNKHVLKEAMNVLKNVWWKEYGTFTIAVMNIEALKFCVILGHIIEHIFPKAQVASKAHNLREHYLAQFFMLFLMVWSIMFGVLAQKPWNESF